MNKLKTNRYTLCVKVCNIPCILVYIHTYIYIDVIYACIYIYNDIFILHMYKVSKLVSKVLFPAC